MQSWSQCDAAMVRSFAVRSRRKGLKPGKSGVTAVGAVVSLTGWSAGRTCQSQSGEGIAAPKIPATCQKY